MRRWLLGWGLALVSVQVARPLVSNAQVKMLPQISGVVDDSLGRSVAQATVRLRTAEGRRAGQTASDAQGRFRLGTVTAGTYAVEAAKPGFATATAIVHVTRAGAAPVTLTLTSATALSLPVVVKRTDHARNRLSPVTGGSAYTFNQQALQQLPASNNTAMSQVLLQAPGVAQDSFGQIHIRGEHGELQYQINGVALPEGVTSGFSETFSPRFAQNITLLEGALPAEFGYHTAGVVQIQAKSGASLQGGYLEMSGGQRDTLQPSFELGGSRGNLSYYATGSYLQNNRELEPPTPGPQAIHDFATIGNGFSYLSYRLNPTTRLSLIGGFNVANFQIPANPDQPPAFALAGVPNLPSADVRETQLEQNYFGVAALQGLLAEQLGYQLAAFTRYSTLSFHPDQNGDLIYNGVASRVFRSDWASGLQGDLSYSGLASHIFRAGFYFSGERAEIDNHALVFPGGPGFQTSDQPLAIVDNTALVAWNYGIYLQDEWHPRLLPKLTVNYGARFDLYDGLTRAVQASPRFGLVYQLFQRTTLHAGYARYFTPPPLEAVSTEDLGKFNHTTNQPEVATDSNIAPERAHYFDAGVTQELPLGIRLGLDSYYKQSTDLLDEGQFGPTLVFTPFNYNKGRQYGVEVTTSLTYRELTTYTNFAYAVAQGNEIVSDQFLFGADELAYIRNHYVFLDHDQTFTASWGGAYKFRGFMFTLDGLYGSGLRSGFANTANLPFYIQFNAAIAKSLRVPKIGELEARLAVINLGDWIYPIRNGTGIGVFAPQFGPRRTLYAGIKWTLPFFASAGAH